jgi:hypothetical protein
MCLYRTTALHTARIGALTEREFWGIVRAASWRKGTGHMCNAAGRAVLERARQIQYGNSAEQVANALSQGARRGGHHVDVGGISMLRDDRPLPSS